MVRNVTATPPRDRRVYMAAGGFEIFSDGMVRRSNGGWIDEVSTVDEAELCNALGLDVSWPAANPDGWLDCVYNEKLRRAQYCLSPAELQIFQHDAAIRRLPAFRSNSNLLLWSSSTSRGFTTTLAGSVAEFQDVPAFWARVLHFAAEQSAQVLLQDSMQYTEDDYPEGAPMPNLGRIRLQVELRWEVSNRSISGINRLIATLAPEFASLIADSSCREE